MKAILEFNLPEEEAEHKSALDGGKFQSVLHELDQWLRGLEKHSDKESVSIKEVRDKIHEELSSWSINLY